MHQCKIIRASLFNEKTTKTKPTSCMRGSEFVVLVVVYTIPLVVVVVVNKGHINLNKLTK